MKGYIGIDLSLDNFTATFLASDQGQERQTTLAFPVSKEGWQSFCQEL